MRSDPFSPRVLIPVLLVVAVGAVYGRVGGFEFVSWDDPWYVSRNAHVLGGIGFTAAAWALTTGGDFYWHPLTWWSHQLDATLYGTWAGGHHLTSVLIHAANTVLLFAVFKRMTGSTWRSAVTAALFGLHPLRVESVAWVAERKDVLSGFFWILTIAAYTEYARKPGWSRYLLVTVLFALGLMAKPIIVTLPIVLLLLDRWPLGRLERKGSGLGARGPRGAPGSRLKEGPSLRALVLEKLPLLALGAVVGVATVIVQSNAGAVGGLGQLPLTHRLSNAVVSYARYAWKMIWPANLAAFYPYPAQLPPAWEIALSVALLAAAATMAWRLRLSRPYVLTGVWWYLVTLLPVSGLFQAGDQLMADRFTYLPSIGIALLAAWGGAELAARWRVPRAALAAVTAAAVLAFAATSYAQAASWKDTQALWTHALAVTDGNHRAHAGLAEWLAERGRLDEAVSHYRQAVRLAPAGADYRHGLGMLLAREGRSAEAERELVNAVRLDPTHGNARASLGALLARRGDVAAAIAQYREAIRLEPDLAVAHVNLGLALVQQGRFEDGLRSCSRASQLDSRSFEARTCAGLAFARLGRADEAAGEFREASIINPSSESAYVNLGLALSHAGADRKADAVSAFEQALRINPGNEAVRAALDELRRH